LPTGVFSDLFKQYYPQVEEANRPTIRQFRYFYDREYKKPQRLEARTHPGVYKKDVRPLTSTATASVLGPGSRYEIDATIADIYLVDDEDRSKIIGRPTIYIVIDVFSRMISGFISVLIIRLMWLPCRLSSMPVLIKLIFVRNLVLMSAPMSGLVLVCLM
jgi:hypothetical protein